MTTSCGKVRYITELGAKIALTRIHRDDEQGERRHYRCPRCRGWHLTSEEKHG
jgi:hypothetical protein